MNTSIGMICIFVMWLLGFVIIQHLEKNIQSNKLFDLHGKNYACYLVDADNGGGK